MAHGYPHWIEVKHTLTCLAHARPCPRCADTVVPVLTEFAEQDGRKALPKHTKECKMLTVVGAVMVLAEYTLEGCASSGSKRRSCCRNGSWTKRLRQKWQLEGDKTPRQWSKPGAIWRKGVCLLPGNERVPAAGHTGEGWQRRRHRNKRRDPVLCGPCEGFLLYPDEEAAEGSHEGTGIPSSTALCRYHRFYKCRVWVCGNPASSKAIGTIFQQHLLLCVCVTFGQFSKHCKLFHDHCTCSGGLCLVISVVLLKLSWGTTPTPT